MRGLVPILRAAYDVVCYRNAMSIRLVAERWYERPSWWLFEFLAGTVLVVESDFDDFDKNSKYFRRGKEDR